MQIVHSSTKTKGLFVLSFILFCSWTQSFIDAGNSAVVFESLFFVHLLSMFYLLSLLPSPPLPLLYLFLTDSSDGVDFVSFQVLPVSFFSLNVASREQPAESGPRWPPSLRRPLPARTDLRPLKPLARLWPFGAVAADVGRRLWCRSQTMKMISPGRYSKKARGWVRWLRANTRFLPSKAG